MKIAIIGPSRRAFQAALIAMTACGAINAAQPPQRVFTMPALNGKPVTLTGDKELHVTGMGNPLSRSPITFASPDAWLFLEHVPPSAAMRLLGQMRVNGASASPVINVRVVQYAQGSIIIPHGPDFAAMTAYDGKSLAGAAIPLKCYAPYNGATLGKAKNMGSFRLKRGYMATLAQNENGTGVSLNYVAQDHDIVIDSLPPGLDQGVQFVRIFPWRWVSKKGMSGDIWPKFNCGWYYNWNLNHDSTLDVEYVAIRQTRWWPGLDKQDWKKRGITQLLGYNEPDSKEQSNLTVDQAIEGWPDLLATGLRIGSPAVTDGGFNWIVEFMDKADAKGLRVDFVAIHYYRSFPNPGDPEGAARNFYNFLKQVHDRTHRPIWVTEWNNGANWTKGPDPTTAQQRAAIAAMVKMLDATPFVERYAIYNWVEDVRFIQKKDDSLTPAGEAYRNAVSPIGYVQKKYEGEAAAPASR
jgi:hypothetical protein